jgi:hypothetical protein
MAAPKSEQTVEVDPVAALQPESEIDRINPDPSLVTMPKSGMDLRLQRMGTRQLMRLLRILTHTSGGALVQEVFQFAYAEKPKDEAEREQAAKDFGQRMIALVLLSIPDAENEFMDFIGSMYQPDGFIDKRADQLTEIQRKNNDALNQAYNAAIFNPDPEDTYVLIEAVIRREAKDIYGLGNRLALLFRGLNLGK